MSKYTPPMQAIATRQEHKYTTYKALFKRSLLFCSYYYSSTSCKVIQSSRLLIIWVIPQCSKHKALLYQAVFLCTPLIMDIWTLSNAMTNVMRRHKYSRGLSILLSVPGVLVSFLSYALEENGPFGFGRAPSAS